MDDENAESLITAWRAIIVGDDKSWVLFANGTCVILMDPQPDLAQQATALLREWGPVVVGTSAGDFNVVHLANYPGWVVTSHHPDILTYVAPDEVDEGAADVLIGLLGRAQRDQDARDLRIIHAEDKRPSA